MRISAYISGLLGLARYACPLPSSTHSTPTHTLPSSLTSGLVIVNTTTGVVISNTTTTKGVNDTSPKKGWPHIPGLHLGPGPVIVPEDKLDAIATNHSYSWLTASPTSEEDDEATRRDRRVSTQDRRAAAALIAKRDGPGDPLPPRDRTLADHMENHGSQLPECYRRCMRQEDGKNSIHMGKVCPRRAPPSPPPPSPLWKHSNAKKRQTSTNSSLLI